MYAGPANKPDLSHLAAVLVDLASCEQEARRIIGRLSDAQANWRPSETGWTIAQCLDHLARASTIYAAAMRHAVERTQAAKKLPPKPIQPRWFSRIVLRIVEPPPKPRFPSPQKAVPSSRIAGRDALEAFLRSQEDVRAVIRAGAGFDLNRIRFRIPFFRLLRFTVGTGLLMIAAHNRRHLWQAQRVLECAGFPKS
jgi:hypothetical protein